MAQYKTLLLVMEHKHGGTLDTVEQRHGGTQTRWNKDTVDQRQGGTKTRWSRDTVGHELIHSFAPRKTPSLISASPFNSTSLFPPEFSSSVNFRGR